MFSNKLCLNFLGAATIIAFAISGCMSPGTRLATTPNDSPKSKSQTQELAGTHDGLDRSDKGRKDSRKMIPVTGSGKDKRITEPTRQVSQVDELVKEGDLLRKNKQYEDARVVYHKALLLAPESPVVNHRLAIIADKQRLFSAADYHYQAALKARPRDVNLLSDLGFSYSLRGNEEQAEETLKKALAIDAKHKGAMANLGSLYAQQNRYSDAVAMFRAGATEDDAQRYLAELFPKGRAGDEQMASTERGNPTSNRGTTTLPPENQISISSLSLEELEAELGRRKYDANVRQQIQNQIQGLPSKSERGQSDRSQQRMAATNVRSLDGLQPSWDQDEVMGASATMDSTKSHVSVSHTNTSRQADSQVQTAWGQLNGTPADPKQPVNKSDLPRQLATQLGLGAGPGNMFPILSGIELNRPDSDGVVPVGMTLDSTTNVGRSGFAGIAKIDKGRTDGNDASMSQSIGMTNGNIASRPYDGTWPNSTNTPVKQGLSTNLKGGDSEVFETSGGNALGRNGSGSFNNLNTAASHQKSNSSSGWASSRPSAGQSTGASTDQWPNYGSTTPAAPNNSAPQWPFSSNR